MLEEHVNQIFKSYQNYKDEEGRVRIVNLEEIRKNDYNLNISLYIEPILEEENISRFVIYNSTPSYY